MKKTPILVFFSFFAIGAIIDAMKVCIPKILLCATLFALPFITSASIVINEIAWMGSANGGTAGANANDEWIELYNNGAQSVDITDWVLVGTGDTPSINLSGTISASSFFLLERSNDNSVAGVSADLIYSGSLANTGEKLVLKDSGGSTIYTVDGSDGWKIGGGSVIGDNTTKDTASLVGSTWTTATPTPGTANTSASTPAPEPVQSTGGSSSTTTEQSSTSTLTEPPISAFTSSVSTPYILVSAGSSTRIIMASVDTLFQAASSDLAGEPLLYPRYYWTFGDGGGSRDQNVFYTYERPGDYIVILRVEAGNFSNTDRIDVKVIPADISISNVERTGSTPFIEIKNGSAYEMNLSQWALRINLPNQGWQLFTIPDNTIILPKTTVSFSASRIGVSLAESTSVELLYPNGAVASLYTFPILATSFIVPQTLQQEVEGFRHTALLVFDDKIFPGETSPRSTTTASTTSTTATTTSTTTPLVETPRATQEVVLFEEESPERTVTSWIFGLIALVVITIGGIVLLQKEAPSSDGYDIVEEE